MARGWARDTNACGFRRRSLAITVARRARPRCAQELQHAQSNPAYGGTLRHAGPQAIAGTAGRACTVHMEVLCCRPRPRVLHCQQLCGRCRGLMPSSKGAAHGLKDSTAGLAIADRRRPRCGLCGCTAFLRAEIRLCTISATVQSARMGGGFSYRSSFLAAAARMVHRVKLRRRPVGSILPLAAPPAGSTVQHAGHQHAAFNCPDGIGHGIAAAFVAQLRNNFQPFAVFPGKRRPPRSGGCRGHQVVEHRIHPSLSVGRGRAGVLCAGHGHPCPAAASVFHGRLCGHETVTAGAAETSCASTSCSLGHNAAVGQVGCRDGDGLQAVHRLPSGTVTVSLRQRRGLRVSTVSLPSFPAEGQLIPPYRERRGWC